MILSWISSCIIEKKCYFEFLWFWCVLGVKMLWDLKEYYIENTYFGKVLKEFWKEALRGFWNRDTTKKK